MDLVNNLIVLFLLIFRALFMHLLVGSPFSVCCFSVDGQKLQIEFFVSLKNQRQLFEVFMPIPVENQGLFPSLQSFLANILSLLMIAGSIMRCF